MLQDTDFDRDWREFRTSHLLQFSGGGEVGRDPTDDGGEGEGANAISGTQRQVIGSIKERLSVFLKHQRFEQLHGCWASESCSFNTTAWRQLGLNPQPLFWWMLCCHLKNY